jgi:hypothetical protein
VERKGVRIEWEIKEKYDRGSKEEKRKDEV